MLGSWVESNSLKYSRCQPILLSIILAWLLIGVGTPCGSAQTTLTPWGNVAGMRVNGQPVEFEAGPRVVRSDWLGFSAAVKYLQRPRYSREGPRAIVESEIDGMAFKEVLEDTAPGEATLELQLTAKTNLSMAGAYFCVDLPDAEGPMTPSDSPAASSKLICERMGRRTPDAA